MKLRFSSSLALIWDPQDIVACCWQSPNFWHQQQHISRNVEVLEWNTTYASGSFRAGVPASQARPMIFCIWLVGLFLPSCGLFFLHYFFFPGILKLVWRAWILNRAGLHFSSKSTLLVFLLLSFPSFPYTAFVPRAACAFFYGHVAPVLGSISFLLLFYILPSSTAEIWFQSHGFDTS